MVNLDFCSKSNPHIDKDHTEEIGKVAEDGVIDKLSEHTLSVAKADPLVVDDFYVTKRLGVRTKKHEPDKLII